MAKGPLFRSTHEGPGKGPSVYGTRKSPQLGECVADLRLFWENGQYHITVAGGSAHFTTQAMEKGVKPIDLINLAIIRAADRLGRIDPKAKKRP